MTHTPTPWTVGIKYDTFVEITNGSKTIATVGEANIYPQIEADANHIVRCVNTHDALVEALRALRASIEEYRETGKPNFGRLTVACDKADDALALAEKGA